jgi:predicted MPP superfamily phosphohydrolase
VTRTTEVTIPVRGLDSSLEGLTLVQLSDLHLGMIVGVGRLERIVERVRELNADLVVITGDLVDEDASGLDWMIEPLRRLRSRHGVLAVTGNHEFYTGVSQVERLAAAASIRFLRNEGVTVADGLVVYGMDDPQAAFWGGSRVALEDVVGPKARGSAAILLHHQPIGFERATSMGVDLMLSGHTHAGQLWPIPWISRLLYPWKHGHHVLGTSHMYVSAGVGTWGPPMRVGAPPEIVRITLVRAPD